MRRIKLRKRRKFDKINTIIIVIILLFLSIAMVLGYINNKLSPRLLNFAEMQTQKIANTIINRAVSKQLVNGMDLDKLFSTIQNKDGEIQTIDFNPIIVNKVLNTITTAVHTGLKAVEQGNIELVEIPEDIIIEYDEKKLKRGIVFEFPLGAVTENAFLSNLGPRVPVKLNLIGTVTSNINTKIRQYGINNALIEVSVRIAIVEKINLPLASRDIAVTSDIPVAMKIVQGKIPEYYNSNGLNSNSPVYTLPNNKN